MKTIGFDIDGVLYPWQIAADSYLRSFRGLTEDFNVAWRDISKYANNDLMNNICNMPDICSKIMPSKDTLDILWKLSDRYTLFYITARPDTVRLATETYLRRYGFPQADNLIFTRDKAYYVKLLEIDLYVEDQLIHAESLKDITNLILMRQPWNEEVWSDYITIGNLNELTQIISELEKK